MGKIVGLILKPAKGGKKGNIKKDEGKLTEGQSLEQGAPEGSKDPTEGQE